MTFQCKWSHQIRVNIKLQRNKVVLIVNNKIKKHQVLNKAINQVKIHIFIKINKIKILIPTQSYNIHSKE